MVGFHGSLTPDEEERLFAGIIERHLRALFAVQKRRDLHLESKAHEYRRALILEMGLSPEEIEALDDLDEWGNIK